MLSKFVRPLAYLLAVAGVASALLLGQNPVIGVTLLVAALTLLDLYYITRKD